MTTFADGPAKGQTLMLKRAPIFLRVGYDHESSTFDALDQINDAPKPTEELFAYRLTKEPGMMHIHARGGRGGFYPTAEYQLVPAQPSDIEMRKLESWCAWCHRQVVPAFFVKLTDPVEL